MFADELTHEEKRIWQREHTMPHVIHMIREMEPIDEREERIASYRYIGGGPPLRRVAPRAKKQKQKQ